MKHETLSLSELRAATSAALARALEGDASDRARGLREVAELLVEARGRFYTKDGTPDWRGQSFAYRTWVRETMSTPSTPSDELARTQAAIRYHVSNVLHERLSPDELEGLGLREVSARERAAEKRERHGETINLFSPGGAPIDTAEDLEAVATRIAAVLGRVADSAVAALPVRARRRVAAAFREVERRAGEVAGSASE